MHGNLEKNGGGSALHLTFVAVYVDNPRAKKSLLFCRKSADYTWVFTV